MFLITLRDNKPQVSLASNANYSINDIVSIVKYLYKGDYALEITKLLQQKLDPALYASIKNKILQDVLQNNTKNIITTSMSEYLDAMKPITSNVGIIKDES